MVENGKGNFVIPGIVIAKGAEMIIDTLANDNSFANEEVLCGSNSFQGHLTAYLKQGVTQVLQNPDPTTPLHQQLASFFTCDCPTWMNSTTKEQTERLNDLATKAGLNVIKMAERYPGPQILQRVGITAYDDASTIMCGNALWAFLLTGVPSFSGPGDAAASGFVNLETLKLDKDAMKLIAPDLERKVAEVTPPGTIIGKVSPFFQRKGFVNMGMSTSDQDNIKSGAYAIFRPDILQVSLGTSYTAYIVSKKTIAGFEGNFASNDAEYPYLLLLCKNNGSGSISGVLSMHHYSAKAFDKVTRSLRRSQPGNEGRMALPWFKPEIIPYAPHAPGFVRNNYAKGFRADIRAAVEGNAASLLYAAREKFKDMVSITGVSFVGGAKQNPEIMKIWANMAGVDCYEMAMGEDAAAIGAALTAAADYLRNQPETSSLKLTDVVSRFVEKHKPTVTTPDRDIAEMYRTKFMPAYVAFEAAHAQQRR